MSILVETSDELILSGLQKIHWVRSHMPVLSQLEGEFELSKPFIGKVISMSIHLEAKTANLAYILYKGGAEVHVTGSNTLSTQDDVAAALASLGVNVYAIHGVDDATYREHLKATLACHPHIVIDDGGDLIDLLSDECKEYADRLIGGCEETTTGILRLKARDKDGTLPCAMYAVNDAKSKHYYDNKYGTGQSVMTSIMQTLNLVVAGKVVVVAGYGWCGKGVAMRAAGMGAEVIVTEVDPFKALDATMNGQRVMPMMDAAPLGDIFITVTGCKDVITIDHMRKMKDGAIVCNAGHFDCEVSMRDLAQWTICEPEEVRKNITRYTIESDNPDVETIDIYAIAHGRLVNLASGDGHPAEIMDMSFAVQALAALRIVEEYHTKGRKLPHLYPVPDDIDNFIGEVKLEAEGLKIDRLTLDQELYLQSWEA